MPGAVPTISQHIGNGHLKNVNGGVQNGYVSNGRTFNNHM